MQATTKQLKACDDFATCCLCALFSPPIGHSLRVKISVAQLICVPKKLLNLRILNIRYWLTLPQKNKGILRGVKFTPDVQGPSCARLTTAEDPTHRSACQCEHSRTRQLSGESYDEWVQEMVGMKTMLGRWANVSDFDIFGMRAPRLKPGDNRQLDVSSLTRRREVRS